MKLNQFILSHAKENSQNSKTKSHLNLDLPAECNNFDWNEGKEPIELNDMSPIVFKPTQPDSPIGLDFDQRRAVIGKKCWCDCNCNMTKVQMLLHYCRISSE